MSETEKPDWLPLVYFGTAETPLPDWRAEAGDDDDDDDDDELLPETPPDVVAMLGFDPLDWTEEEPAEAPRSGEASRK